MDKPHLVALSNDEQTLREVARLSAAQFAALTTRDYRRFLGWIDNTPGLATVVVDQLLPNASGIDLLQTLRTMKPAVRRVLLSDYTDLAGMIDGIHSGLIQAIVQTPLTASEFLAAIVPQQAAGVDAARKVG